MSIWGRIMSTVEGAITAWNAYHLVPHPDKPYGDIALRLFRYNVALAYYHNTIYDQLDRFSTALRQDERLYKFIRGIVNPVRQENNLLVSYTYRGTVDTATLRGGSMPLVFDNTRLEMPLTQVIKWSNLDQQLGVYVRNAALYGDAAWWVVDEPQRRRVRLTQVEPARIRYVERDDVGNVKAAIIEYERDEEPDVTSYTPNRSGAVAMRSTDSYLYTLKVTREKFETFKDGKPWAFHADTSGQLVSEWPNIYGFVPLKLAYYAHGKDGWGQNSFFGAVRRQIDEINDQASIINDSVRNVVVPLLQAIGATGQPEIKVTREDKDSIAIASLPPGVELKSVTVPLDIAGASANRAVLLAELEKNMPVLALQRIRDIGGNLSGVAIQNMFGDATSTVENLRKNLNPALCAALQMAVTMGAVQGYDGFEGFNINSFDNGDMELTIGETPVIEDRLSRADKVDKLVVVAGLPTGTKRQALAEMGYSEPDIEKIVNDDAVEQEERRRQAARGFAEGTFDDDEDEGDDEDTGDEETAAEEETDARAESGQAAA